VQPLLTILVCTHDRARLLHAVLESLACCERPRNGTVEILVVANACRDATHATLDEWASRPAVDGLLPLRWLAEPTPGKSHALNLGMANAQGRWVAVVDDDHRVSHDFLVRIAQAIENRPEATLLCGRILPDWDGREPAWVHDTGPYRVYPLPIPRQDFGDAPRELTREGPIPGGGNQVIRADAARRLGAFCTELGPQGHDLGGGEDTEYMLRALRAGERLWYEPRIVQYHHVDLQRLTLRYLMRKAYQRSAAAVSLHAPHAPHAPHARAREDGQVPLYLYRKLAGYAFGALTSLGARRRRFYLVRCAAALGEMAGHAGHRGGRADSAAATAGSDHA